MPPGAPLNAALGILGVTGLTAYFGLVKVGDTIGVLAKVGEQGFVRFFINGKESGPGYRPGEEIKDDEGNATGEVLGPIKSPLQVVVHLKRPGCSIELLPDATMPTGI